MTAPGMAPQSGTMFHALAYLFIVQHYGHTGDKDKTKPFDGARNPNSWCVRHRTKKYASASEWIIACLSDPPPISQISHIRYKTCLWHPDELVNQNGEGDHVHPQAKGGYETAWYLCKSCNSSKNKKNLFEWLQRKPLLPPTDGVVECLRIDAPGIVCLEHAFYELLWLATKLDYQYATIDTLRAPAPDYYRYTARALRQSKAYLPAANWQSLSDIVRSLSCP